MSEGKHHVFICGCPRSGTTALWQLLGASKGIAIGVERFGTLFFSNPLQPELFEEERFFDLREGDTFYSDLVEFDSYYAEVRDRYASAGTVGDKIPKLYERFEGIEETLPNARILFLFRNIFDVAASYKARAANPNDKTWRRTQGVEAAISDWTSSIAQYRAFKNRLNILPVCYERLFHFKEGLDEVLSFAGIPDDPNVIERYEEISERSDELESARRRDITMKEVFRISTSAPFGGYREIVGANQ